MKEIYLDNTLRTRPFPQAVDAMLPFLKRDWGTPTAPHNKGQQLLPALEENYRSIYQLLRASENATFVLTSSAAEGINQIVDIVYEEVTRTKGKNGFLTAKTDEAPAILAFDRLQEKQAVPKMIEVGSDGRISPTKVVEAITPRTALLSLSWANALTGVIHPAAEIGDICRERGILFHLEASHVLGKLLFSFEDIGAHYITFSGDLVGGVPGTGGLLVHENAPYRPWIVGGAEQANLRAGSWNVPGLVALGAAARELLTRQDAYCTEVARLRDRLEQGVQAEFPEATPLFRETERLPHVSAIAFPGVANESLQYALNREGIYTSIGGGHLQQIGLLLEATGIQEGISHSTLSFSLSWETTEEEIDFAIQRIGAQAKRLRSYAKHLTPAWSAS